MIEELIKSLLAIMLVKWGLNDLLHVLELDVKEPRTTS